MVPKILTYILGLAPVALGQHWLRGAVGDLAGFAIVIAYLVLLRFVAEKLGT